MADVVVFAPSPLLTVTLEDEAGSADIHVHAGGQGVWQARMLRTLGRDVAICAALIGETGRAVRHLLEDEGIEVHAVERAGHGAAYVHDRRAGQREPVAELPGDALTRHDLDELFAVVLREAMNARVVLLSGPATDGILPDDVYRRLAADLAAAGIPVVADLAGTRLAAALAGGVHVAKVSQDELVDAGAVTGTSVPELVAAARRLRQAGAHNVVVTRADRDRFQLRPDVVGHRGRRARRTRSVCPRWRRWTCAAPATRSRRPSWPPSPTASRSTTPCGSASPPAPST